LYVAKPHRRRGIGTELIQAGMVLARELGYHSIYTTTNVAGGILEYLQWEYLGPVNHHGEDIALYRYVINSIST
jgi:GNAT superfamily N-acetyltransferase